MARGACARYKRVAEIELMLPLTTQRITLHNPLFFQRQCTRSRLMFTLFGGSPTDNHQNYHERRILPYRQRQLYELVADVESYRHFVPYCTASRVLTKTPKDAARKTVKLEAELKVGFMGLEEQYISKVECRPYEMVQAVASAEIPLFKSLITTWRFQPASPLSPQATADLGPISRTHGITANERTLVTFDLEYAFNNALYAHVSNAFFGQVSKMMIRAFEERCLEVFGPGQR